MVLRGRGVGRTTKEEKGPKIEKHLFKLVRVSSTWDLGVTSAEKKKKKKKAKSITRRPRAMREKSKKKNHGNPVSGVSRFFRSGYGRDKG